MKLKNMKIGVPYIVTKGGDTLKVGDHIERDHSNCITCKEAVGWLYYDEWKRLRNEVEIDVEKIKNLQEFHQAKVDMYASYLELVKKRKEQIGDV